MEAKTNKTDESNSVQYTFFGEKDLDKPDKTIRIATSGDVALTKLEVAIIDTPEFQHLRKFRQLGTSHLVYPSANHSRFEHSLGVLKEVINMMSFIENNVHSSKAEREISSVQKRIARLGALLHDIANIPFGHTLEDETNVISSSQEDVERFNLLIDSDNKLSKLLKRKLGGIEHQLLKDILTAKKDPPSTDHRMPNVKYISDFGENAFIVDLIKNTVCADLLDYLKRDTYFCGLPLSIPDRFLIYLFLHQDENSPVRRLAIRLWKANDHQPRASLISELVQLLETRYFLAERVYFHHAKQISSSMIASAVWFAMNQDTNSLTYNKLASFGDDELIQELQKSKIYPIASRIAQAVSQRALYKRFYVINRDMIDSDKLHDHLAFLKQTYHSNARKRAEAEMMLSDISGLSPGDVIIYCPNPEMNLKLAEMLVTWRTGVQQFQVTDDQLIKRKIDSILSSHKQLWQLQVFVRVNAIESQSKCDLLFDWCKALFEGVGFRKDHLAFRRAIRAAVEDNLREKGKSVEIDKIDKIVEKAVQIKSKGEKINRAFIEKLVNKEIDNTQK